ncbi:MAG TPA: LptA/OstA family protein [Terriglobales bacterium]|nr:LptA/OstA family protein [Terriglobales bacterium]
MSLDTRRLRKWFAIAITALLLVVIGFYARNYIARYMLERTITRKAEKLGIDVQQSTTDFSFSKSEGGRTIFTVRASKAVQVKSGRAELHEVNIVIYGRDNDRFDQIYGSDFEYEPSTGEISARGEVHIDLQGVADRGARPDQAPPKELRNTIHLKTSGLTFNRNTGLAQTNNRIEFRIPQASGSAMGAIYDSRAQKLTLRSQIEVIQMAEQTGEPSGRLNASHAVFTNEPRRMNFSDARVTRSSGDISARQLIVFLRDDNSIDRLAASGGVVANTTGKNATHATAPAGEVVLDARNQIKTAQLTGGVSMNAEGDQPMHGTAGRMLLDFGAQSRLQRVRAVENVRFVQNPPRNKSDGQSMALTSDAVSFTLEGSGRRRAETGGPAQITLASATASTPSKNSSTTVATAGRFVADFDRRGRLANVTGSPNARVVSSTPGQPDKTTSSDILTLRMNPAGGLDGIVQQGNFHYIEAAAKKGETSTEAFAERATYDPQTELFVLTGSPRVTDAGATTTADRMRINRRTGDAVAEGSVKTTYSQLEAQPSGALLASSDPIHVTATTMTARRSEESARFSGGARLWQGANIVEAPTIEFNRGKRTVVAQGNPSRLVSTVFVEQAEKGKQTPVNVTGQRLTYADSQRQAKFEGGVVMRSVHGTVTANQVTVFLQPRNKTAAPTEKSASELDRVVAEGRVVIQQQARRGTGNRLTYVAKDGSFTLTGGPPSIFDAEHGKVTGVSLTFFSRDDRVLIEGGESAQSVTKARVIK